MKQLLLAFAFFSSFASHAQWIQGELYDENGAKSDYFYQYQIAMGTFAPMSKKEKKCGFYLENMPEDSMMVISVYPKAKKKMVRWSEASMQWVKITKPSKEEVYIYSYCDKSGLILIISEDYYELMDAIEADGVYHAEIQHELNEDTTVYRFSFGN